jgi:hypothetical protein
MMKERFLQKRETFAEEEFRQADHTIATIIINQHNEKSMVEVAISSSEHVWYVPVVTRRQEPARLQFFRVLCPPANHQ